MFSSPPISDENTSPGEETRSSPQEALEQDHVTKAEGHMASQESHLAPMESPFSRTRSATISGGGRPKIRARRPKKNVSGHLAADSGQTSHDSHMTSSMETALPLTASSDSSSLTENSSVTPVAFVSIAVEDGGEREDVPSRDGRKMAVPSIVEDGERVKHQPVKKRDEQFIIKCQVCLGNGDVGGEYGRKRAQENP